MSQFVVYPAIDLRHGQVVRLKEGDPSQQTSYSPDPALVAEKWIDAGAKWLHVINLDGAFDEKGNENLQALSAILNITQKSNVDIQFGGGIRNLDVLTQVMDMGVKRAILGTAAIENELLVSQAVNKYGEHRIALSLDARDGFVQVHGWKTQTSNKADEMALHFHEKGINWIIFTDISRDGLQTGINIQSTKSLSTIDGLNVIASGGVSGWGDIIKAYEGDCAGIIVGRALYENQFRPEQLLTFPENFDQVRNQ